MMEYLTNQEQTFLSNLTNNNNNNSSSTQIYFITFVRDPIDHFLSGWAECGHRSVKKDKKYSKRQQQQQQNDVSLSYEKWEEDILVLNWMERLNTTTSHGNDNVDTNNNNTPRQNVPKYMDTMVLEWLNFTKYSIQSNSKSCARHSFPQANFLLQEQRLLKQILLIGDLNELSSIWKYLLQSKVSIRFDNNTKQQKKKKKNNKKKKQSLLFNPNNSRNSSSSFFKQTYFPQQRMDWLQNSTIRQLCQFVALDYVLFDFEPPEQCQDLLDRHGMIKVES